MIRALGAISLIIIEKAIDTSKYYYLASLNKDENYHNVTYTFYEKCKEIFISFEYSKVKRRRKFYYVVARGKYIGNLIRDIHNLERSLKINRSEIKIIHPNYKDCIWYEIKPNKEWFRNVIMFSIFLQYLRIGFLDSQPKRLIKVLKKHGYKNYFLKSSEVEDYCLCMELNYSINEFGMTSDGEFNGFIKNKFKGE